MSAILVFVGIIVLILFRVPVAFAILGPCLVYLAASPYSWAAAIQQVVVGIDSWPLLAVPLFILVGKVANEAGIADRLFESALAIIGRVQGSLAYVNVAVSLGFSWMSGAALADAAALGSIEVPAMRRNGYPAKFSVGITGASTIIGPIMPPSIPAIVYSAVGGVSIGALFAASVLPAFAIAFALLVSVFIWARRYPHLRGSKISGREKLKRIALALPALGAPVIILGGILGGYFTPTEAAAVAALYIVALGILSGKLSLLRVWRLLVSSGITSAAIMIIIAASSLLAWILVREQIPAEAARLLTGVIQTQLMFLLVINLLLIVVGAFMEAISAILVLVPILLPIAIEFGVDPLQFGVIVVLNLMIALLTPPVGGVLYVLSSVTGIGVVDVVKGVAPFYIPLYGVLALVTFVPEVTTFLPDRLGM